MNSVVRLAGGLVTARGTRIWATGPDGAPVDAASARLAPGAPVAIGPAGAGETEAVPALAELAALVRAGGALAAGAGADLGAGFTSARLDGARGDRRDAVFAALRALGLDRAGRLGDRPAILVALFGPAATKPVGTAATEAIRQGRWAAVHLASAASGLLGPEQLERLLGLTVPSHPSYVPDGVDPCPHGMPSALAADLGIALAGVPRARRLDLLVDLWNQVCVERARAARREGLRAVRARQDRVDDLRRRCEQYEDQRVLDQIRSWFGREPTLGEAARWIPPAWYWRDRFTRLVSDAVSATVLLRTAVAVSDLGMAAGLVRCRHELRAAVAMAGEPDPRATRRVPGLTGLPARPTRYVRDIHGKLESAGADGALDAKAEAFVTQRLARARDYGVVVLEAVDEFLGAMLYTEPRGWWSTDADLHQWRVAAGYTRAPRGWEQPPLPTWPEQDRPAPLAQRLRDNPAAEPADVETADDLLWYADLADALAQRYGHEEAAVEYRERHPEFIVDPAPAQPAPLSPRTDSIPLAAAGAAQLVSLGAQPSRRVRTWTGLVGELVASAAVAEALTGAFPVPPPVAALDGARIPGTKARLELARGPRQLAEWSHFMGNCIAGESYLEGAAAGTCVLAAVRDRDGRLVANVDLHPVRRGWRIDELRARFNDDPDPELAKRLTAWVSTIAPADPPGPVPAPPARLRAGRPARRRTSSRVVREVEEALTGLAGEAMADPETVDAARVLAAVARRLDGDAPSSRTDPATVLTALRRVGTVRLTDACRRALRDATPRLARLWAASGTRPLARALAGLDPRLTERHGRLEALLADAPLPGSVRRLARRPELAPARSMDLVGQRVRAAIARLARAADPALAEAVTAHPTPPVLCALVLAVTSWAGDAGPQPPPSTAVTAAGAVRVPGFPASSLTDEAGPWQAAWPDASELGAAEEPFWRQVGSGGLLVPTDWLGTGGWPALWGRAARNAS